MIITSTTGDAKMDALLEQMDRETEAFSGRMDDGLKKMNLGIQAEKEAWSRAEIDLVKIVEEGISTLSNQSRKSFKELD